MEIRELAQRLGEYRIVFANEHDFQDGIQDVLDTLSKAHGFQFEREYRLSAADRPDFFLPAEGIAIECKIKGSTSEVFRQLSRYAEHESVNGIILATSRRTHYAPTELNHKPIYTVIFR